MFCECICPPVVFSPTSSGGTARPHLKHFHLNCNQKTTKNNLQYFCTKECRERCDKLIKESKFEFPDGIPSDRDSWQVDGKKTHPVPSHQTQTFVRTNKNLWIAYSARLHRAREEKNTCPCWKQRNHVHHVITCQIKWMQHVLSEPHGRFRKPSAVSIPARACLTRSTCLNSSILNFDSRSHFSIYPFFFAS